MPDLGVLAGGTLLGQEVGEASFILTAPLIWMQLEEASQKPCGSCYPRIIPSQQKALG